MKTFAQVAPTYVQERIEYFQARYDGACKYLQNVIDNPKNWYDHSQAVLDATILVMYTAEEFADYCTYADTAYC